MAHRKPIDSETEARVLSQSARRCCLCFWLDQDTTEKLGQIAHLDENPSHNDEDNLAYLCFDHHVLYDSKSNRHKKYTSGEVKSARAQLFEWVKNRRIQWMVVLDGVLEDFDKDTVEALGENLRSRLKDGRLVFRKIERGSVRPFV